MSEIERKTVFKKIATQFVVGDVVATAEYYQNILGFKLLNYFGEPPIYAMLFRGDVEMHFGKADKQVDISKTYCRSQGFDAYIWVNDINALFDELTAVGADIVEGPVRRVYNSTEVVIRDCNRFTLVFGD